MIKNKKFDNVFAMFFFVNSDVNYIHKRCFLSFTRVKKTRMFSPSFSIEFNKINNIESGYYD